MCHVWQTIFNACGFSILDACLPAHHYAISTLTAASKRSPAHAMASQTWHFQPQPSLCCAGYRGLHGKVLVHKVPVWKTHLLDHCLLLVARHRRCWRHQLGGAPKLAEDSLSKAAGARQMSPPRKSFMLICMRTKLSALFPQLPVLKTMLPVGISPQLPQPCTRPRAKPQQSPQPVFEILVIQASQPGQTAHHHHLKQRTVQCMQKLIDDSCLHLLFQVQAAHGPCQIARPCLI